MFPNFNSGYVGGLKGQHIWPMNSHKPHKGVYTINIPMTNYLVPSVHQSSNLFIFRFWFPNQMLATIQNNLQGKIPTNKSPSRSHHVPTIPLRVMIQFEVPGGKLCSTKSMAFSKDKQYNKNHLLCCCLCKWCCLMFNIQKMKRTNCGPLLPWTTLLSTPSPRPLIFLIILFRLYGMC
jgi:hypothetical protein